MFLRIGTIDTAIVVVYIAAMVALGLWIGRGQRGMSDYVVGGRDVPWWAVLVSIVATETSSATFLSVPGIAYAGDLTFLQLPFGYVIGRYMVAWVLLPHYFQGELFTAYEVLGKRFGGATRQAASLVFLATRSLADGLRLYLTAIPIYLISGFDMTWSVVLIGVVTIVYTFIGGIKAVVWTDFVQFIVYVTGGVLACALLIGDIPGGMATVIDFARDHAKLRVINPAFDLTQAFTLWAGVIGGAFVSFASHGADQLMVQRYLCARSEREARRALVCSGWVVLVQFVLFLSLGVALAAYYGQNPPDRPFSKSDEVFPTYIVDHLPIGMVGLTLAAVLSAAMSTLSSSLNASATTFVNDFYLRAVVGDSPPGRAPQQSGSVLATRLLTIVFGLIQIAVGVYGPHLAGTVVERVLDIAAFSTGIILGLFALGVLTERVTQRAALVALLGGLAIVSILKGTTSIAWPWYAVIGSVNTFLIGIAVSHMLPNSRNHS